MRLRRSLALASQATGIRSFLTGKAGQESSAAIAETLIPLVPGMVIALLAGTLAARGFTGSRVTPYPEIVGTDNVSLTSVPVPVPVPWVELGALAFGAIAATVIVTAIGLLFLRSSTDPTELRAAA